MGSASPPRPGTAVPGTGDGAGTAACVCDDSAGWYRLLRPELTDQGRGGGFAKMFSTHPPIAERIDRLEKMQMGIR